MISLFDVNTIAFEVLGYALSWLELIGTLLYLASVWLIARQNIWNWPIGIASVLLYMLLFYQVQLYSDTLEQLYYLVASAYGWALWLRRGAATEQPLVPYLSRRAVLIGTALGTLTASLLLGGVMTQIHRWLPILFPLPAAFPWLDALTTVMSFSAMWLLAQKRLESWAYWIIVDVIGIWLYSVQGVRFVALLYVVLLVLAVNGLVSWWRATRTPASAVV